MTFRLFEIISDNQSCVSNSRGKTKIKFVVNRNLIVNYARANFVRYFRTIRKIKQERHVQIVFAATVNSNHGRKTTNKLLSTFLQVTTVFPGVP